MAEHAHEALPGLELFFAEGLAEVGDDDEGVRQSAFAKGGTAHAPAAGGVAGQTGGEQARGLAFEQFAEAEIGGGFAKEAFGRLFEQALRGAVGEAERFAPVEGKDGDVDLGHDGAEERGGFDGAEALLAEDSSELVDLGVERFEWVFAVEPCVGADREVAFAHGGEEVGGGLQRAHDAPAHGTRKAEPEAEDQQRERPEDAFGIAALEEQDERHDDGRQAGEQSVDEDELVVVESPHGAGMGKRSVRANGSTGACEKRARIRGRIFRVGDRRRCGSVRGLRRPGGRCRRVGRGCV